MAERTDSTARKGERASPVAARSQAVAQPAETGEIETGDIDDSTPRWDHSVVHESLGAATSATEFIRVMADVLIAAKWDVTRSDDGLSLGAELSNNRAAQLEPTTPDARRLLGMWSIKDVYPPGIARGGCVLANFSYVLTAEVSEEAGRSRADISCEETIAPYRGVFPDPELFYVRSELNKVDPIPAIRRALEAAARAEEDDSSP